MNKSIRKWIVFAMIMTLLTGCGSTGRKKTSRDEYAFCEHIVSVNSLGQDTIPGNVVLDADGFIAVKENVYVNTDSLNIRREPRNESQLVSAAPYGTMLVRTGIGQEGWDRVEYDSGVCYVGHELVTSVPIQPNKSFDFSTAALAVVDTKRQQYTYDDMVNDLKELRESFGAHMKLNSLGTTADNRNVYEVVIGSQNARRDIYFIGGVCGAEYMTSLVVMKQIEYYLHYYEEGSYDGYAYTDLFDNVRIHAVPMLNPDSVEISQHYLSGIRAEQTKLLLKEWYDRDRSGGGINLNLDNYLMFFYANSKGTDLRKNFPYQWDLTATQAFPGSNGFRGDMSASEAETKAILHSIHENAPSVVVTYHTSGSRIYYNYAQSEEILKKAREYGAYLGRMMTYENNDRKLLEDGYGTLSGYCNNVLKIPALTVYMGNGSAPLSLNEFSAIWNACRDSWAAMQIKMIEW